MDTSYPFYQGPTQQPRNPEPLSVRYFLKLSVKAIVFFVLIGVVAELFIPGSIFWSLKAAFYILAFGWSVGILIFWARLIWHDIKKYNDA